MGMLSDWILYRLSGRFVTDPSVGSSSAMFDLRRRRWSPAIAELCGLDVGHLSRRSWSRGTQVGEVTRRAAQETGLAPGTPVVSGGADTQLGPGGDRRWTGPTGLRSSAAASGRPPSSWTGPCIDPKVRLRTLCHAFPGQWMMEGIGFYCGLTMRWFRDAFCQSEKEEAKRRGTDAYAMMEGLASAVPPGSNGVLGIFSNLMNSKRWVHASPSFMQFEIGDPARSGKKECIRAIEESAAYVALGHLKIIESITRGRTDRVLLTGGASKGVLWPQVISDVLGVRVNIPVVKESTALGSAICAGRGAGWYDDIQEASRRMARIEKRLEPSRKNHELYERLYSNWSEVYERSLAMVEEGLVRPLWRCRPGS